MSQSNSLVLTDDEPYMYNGAMNASMIGFFTEGDCWALAEALHRITGWPNGEKP